MRTGQRGNARNSCRMLEFNKLLAVSSQQQKFERQKTKNKKQTII